jgi:hypothetical protein
MGLHGLTAEPCRAVVNYTQALLDLDIEEEKYESYNPAAYTQAYQGEYSPQAAKAKKKRRKKNKVGRKSRKTNRK